jgi:hypothetical protein
LPASTAPPGETGGADGGALKLYAVRVARPSATNAEVTLKAKTRKKRRRIRKKRLRHVNRIKSGW